MINNIPKISIVTISYNIVSDIEKTIKSVINQTYTNIEYIVIDGGSTDGTVDIIKKYSDRITYWVSERDKGIYDAMNKGIEAATGEWINFMNAGDTFFNNDVLNNLKPFLDNKIDIIYGDLVLETPFGVYWKKPDNIDSMKRKMVFGHQASFINTKYHKINQYDTTYKSSGDYAFFYNAYMNNAKFKYTSIKVALFDAKSGISKDNFYIANLEDLRIYKKEHILSYRIILYLKYTLWKFKRILKTILKGKILNSLMKRKMTKDGYIAI